jgi:hypothetical protein
MQYATIKAKIETMKVELERTREAAAYDRGALNDALRVVIPMMEDQVKLMEAILELMKTPTLTRQELLKRQLEINAEKLGERGD